MKKQTIEVRKYLLNQTDYGSEEMGKITGNYGRFESVAVIKRVVWSEVMGNFCPFFCRYKRERRLVHSDEGDLSDPFRSDESYLKSLFIKF